MKYSTLFFFLGLLFFSACKKETLDFSSLTHFGVKEVLKSDNCDADCGDRAECEGETIKVKGELDASNINASDHQFYLIDEGDDGFRLEVSVAESISEEVFQKLNGQGGKRGKVAGVMEGYDAPTNATCKRQFTLRISDATDVTVE